MTKKKDDDDSAKVEEKVLGPGASGDPNDPAAGRPVNQAHAGSEFEANQVDPAAAQPVIETKDEK